MIYFLRPEISEIKSEVWKDFYTGTYEVLKRFKPHGIVEIGELDSFSLEVVSSKDLLIFFNPNNKNFELNKVLKKAVEREMNIFPISTLEANRFPPEIVSDCQSFDTITEKKLRGLDDAYIKVIGECFGREVIISHFPALFDKEMNIFLSHRRRDGEKLSQLFKNSLHEKKEIVFIDLHEVRTGEETQEKIDDNLKEDADILIFIQTKTTFESFYQLKELKRAFELSIPVLWVTVGLERDKEFKKLSLHPVGKPHFELDEITSAEANLITNYAFDIIRLKKQRLLDSIIYKFKTLKDNGITYNEVCDRDNIYSIEEEYKDKIFGDSLKKQRIFKCLCRKYKEEDLINLKEYLTVSKNFRGNCILSSMAESEKLDEEIFLKNYDEFLKTKTDKELKGGVIISGSFPDSIDLKYQQNIIDALSTVVEETLKRGGKIIFGSHPTFQGLIFEKAKEFNSGVLKRVKLYVSKQFEGRYDVEYFKENSEVFEIEKALSGEVAPSLTKMRKAMISDKEVRALICIGGKEKGTSLTIVPGIDEEIALAKERELPVFILGSTSGRSKKLIKEGFENPIVKEEKREEVTHGNNFKLISETILDEISL